MVTDWREKRRVREVKSKLRSKVTGSLSLGLSIRERLKLRKKSKTKMEPKRIKPKALSTSMRSIYII